MENSKSKSEFMDSIPCNRGTRLQQIKFVNNEHLCNAFTAIDAMRNNNQLCDIILEVDGNTLRAHKVVLAATSLYFHAMFNGELSEKDKSMITFHGISFEALQLLIDYAYTGEITISENNVQSLLPAASLFQVSSVREACCRFLLKQLDPSNCLGIRQFADTHSCEELHQKSDKYIVENFQEVALTEEFLLLPFCEVEDLISSNSLNVNNEECVYDAVMRWVKYDIESRKDRLGLLLNHIRLPLTTRTFLLDKVSEEPLIQTSPQGKDLLIEAMKYHLSPESRPSMNSIRTMIRRPEGLRTYLFAIGGGSLFEIHYECEFYNPAADQWSSFTSLSQKRSRLGVTALDRFIYAIGGFSDNKELSTGEYYDPVKNIWWPTKSMGTKRSCLGVTSLNGLIYVAGGYDGASCLDSVERYDPLVDSWSSVVAMGIPRRHGRLTALDGCLYALGGFDGSNYQSSMERLDPREGKWHFVSSMIRRRSNCGVAVLNGKLYAVGGNDGSLCMNTVERFDPLNGKWQAVTNMHSKRATHELVLAEGYLYAIGGNDGSASLSSVERYDPDCDKWIKVNSMIRRRSSVGAAALECQNLEKITSIINN